MHEFSIAAAVVESACEEARRANAMAISEIELEVGDLSGVDVDALEFALSFAVKDSMLENVVVNIIRREGQGRCSSCRHAFPMKEIVALCPECGMPAGEILDGEQLRIVSLTVKD